MICDCVVTRIDEDAEVSEDVFILAPTIENRQIIFPDDECKFVIGVFFLQFTEGISGIRRPG